ncbi:MAG: hypothetical protein KY462_14760 [Actinobacteria bacterium]|nr:hypothetical protein [Actinomycetota bacterium]
MTRLSRHAKNKLRWIRRDAPAVSEEGLVAALEQGDVLGEDQRGNVRMTVEVSGTRLTVVVDPDDELVITVWRG